MEGETPTAAATAQLLYDVLTHGVELEASSSVVAGTSSVIREHGQVKRAEDG
jgi:hypothetical protein